MLSNWLNMGPMKDEPVSTTTSSIENQVQIIINGQRLELSSADVHVTFNAGYCEFTASSSSLRVVVTGWLVMQLTHRSPQS